MYLPDVGGLDPYDAALEFASHGIAVAPFDPSKGKGKSCWNLFGYREITTKLDQLRAWNLAMRFQALATSPGEFGCVVIDVDKPRLCPQHLRPLLNSAPYINTRPSESPNRGHYWFALPAGLTFGNPSLGFGEVRCVGGGVVLPPYQDRYVVRSGVPPVLPEELAKLLLSKVFASPAVQAGAGVGISVEQFCAKYQSNRRPHKIEALLKLHRVMLQRGRNPHDAMREALRVGLGEAKIGYVPASRVIAALQKRWERDPGEFSRLVSWAAQVAENSDAQVLQLASDRCPGTDSREYAGYKPHVIGTPERREQ
jgi:hypothetical protein